jgi:predicted enzyme related to lactoylglutathione lyase
MNTKIKPGAVIFSADQARLAKFYQATTGLSVFLADDDLTVLGSEHFELVLHALKGEPPTKEPPDVRHDSYLKVFFPVQSLAEARTKAAALGGRLEPQDKEWTARGFRACEAVDPEGNVIQFRENAP